MMIVLIEFIQHFINEGVVRQRNCPPDRVA